MIIFPLQRIFNQIYKEGKDCNSWVNFIHLCSLFDTDISKYETKNFYHMFISIEKVNLISLKRQLSILKEFPNDYQIRVKYNLKKDKNIIIYKKKSSVDR